MVVGRALGYEKGLPMRRAMRRGIMGDCTSMRRGKSICVGVGRDIGNLQGLEARHFAPQGVQLPPRRRSEAMRTPRALGSSSTQGSGNAAKGAGPVEGTSVSEIGLSFPFLDPDDFRHPLDRENTQLLRAIPGLQQLTRASLGPLTEEVMVLENVASAVLVSPEQLPSLYALLTEACEVLSINPVPDMYIKQAPTVNAYTLAVQGKQPFLVLHTALVELLNERELQAVIAHELSHIKCDHGVWLTCANMIALSASTLPGLGALISSSIEDSLLRWLRAAELTCDRGALLAVQDPKIVASAMMKMAGGSPSICGELSVDAFIGQARLLDEAASSPLGWWLNNARSRQLTHPLPVLRAREIDRWSMSADYKGILTRGTRR